jgi:hypothetical protein
MSHLDRATGFYWIDGANGEPEPARWDAENEVWHLIGVMQPQEEEDVTVLDEMPLTLPRAMPTP